LNDPSRKLPGIPTTLMLTLTLREKQKIPNETRLSI
jgi:hypothetical protein